MTYEEKINSDSEQHTILSEPALRLEASVEESISYLRANLHPSTVEYLELMDWMVDKPFPYDVCNADDDSWVDEAEAAGDADIVPMEQIMHDREVWRDAR